MLYSDLHAIPCWVKVKVHYWKVFWFRALFYWSYWVFVQMQGCECCSCHLLCLSQHTLLLLASLRQLSSLIKAKLEKYMNTICFRIYKIIRSYISKTLNTIKHCTLTWAQEWIWVAGVVRRNRSHLVVMPCVIFSG